MPTLVAPRPRHDSDVPEADALIAEARARRRRRRLVGLVSVPLASAAITTWLGRDIYRHSPNHKTVPNAQLTTEGPCASAMSYGPLPVWARSGFQPANVAMPYVLGAHGDIVAVLWARNDPLYSPPKPGRGNKILWVSRLPVSRARQPRGHSAPHRRCHCRRPGRSADGHWWARPSGIDMPQAGCWQFTLRWSGHQDSVDLAYTTSGV